MTKSVLPSERTYVRLREEGDRFIGLIRTLNEAKMEMIGEESEETLAAVDAALEAMHDSVRTMGELAGKGG